MFGLIQKMDRYSNKLMSEREKIDFIQEIVDNGMVWDMHQNMSKKPKPLWVLERFLIWMRQLFLMTFWMPLVLNDRQAHFGEASAIRVNDYETTINHSRVYHCPALVCL